MDRRLVASLNRCIETCIDAERAYGVAAAIARGPELKAWFQSKADERERFVVELQRAVDDLGAFPENEGSLKGAARRHFMNLARAVEPTHDDHRVIADLLREERAALETYDEAVPEGGTDRMKPDLRVMIREQRAAIRLAQDELSRSTAA